MKTIYLLVICSAFLLPSCDKHATAIGQLPDCILKRIETLKNEPVRNPPASIWQYEYRGATVFYEPPFCCDAFGTLYDSDCNIICHPDGGISGSGDGRCPGIFDELKNGKQVWKDSRKIK
ncbi:DUF6970 domain-containing protein [Niabella terrae]